MGNYVVLDGNNKYRFFTLRKAKEIYKKLHGYNKMLLFVNNGEYDILKIDILKKKWYNENT